MPWPTVDVYRIYTEYLYGTQQGPLLLQHAMAADFVFCAGLSRYT
jgi:hypothetical protein